MTFNFNLHSLQLIAISLSLYFPQSALLCVRMGLNLSWYSVDVMNAHVIPWKALGSNPFITLSQN